MDHQESTENNLPKGEIVRESYSIVGKGNSHRTADIEYFHLKEDVSAPDTTMVTTMCRKAGEAVTSVYDVRRTPPVKDEKGVIPVNYGEFHRILVDFGLQEMFVDRLTSDLPEGRYSYYTNMMGSTVMILLLDRTKNLTAEGDHWKARLAKYSVNS